MKKLLLEAILVAVVGAILAFAANALSPRGLNLSSNYFPGDTGISSSPSPRPKGHQATDGLASASQSVAQRLRDKGLEVVEGPQAEQLFRDPRYEQELILFVDARNDQHYEEGHVPGAYQFDHYHPERYLAALLPACQKAQQIVVYCKGGDCEDSEFAAIMLRDSAGVPKEKLLVYAGGITDWESNHRPIETGARKSGQMRATK